MKTETVDIAGAFRVRVSRAGQGEPLVYLHGLDGPPFEAAFIDSLAESRSLILPEHPGFGESTGIEEVDDILDLTLYYRQLLEDVIDGPVDVVGHSLGGMFAAELAALCPWLVRKLVLVCPFGLWLEETPIPDLFVMSPNQLQRASWSDPQSHAAQAAMTASTNGASGPVAIVARAMNLSAAGRFLWPIPDRGLRKRLPLIKAPTLILTGADDGIVPPAYGDAFAALIPGARAVRIAGAGHHPMLEQPEEFGRLVSDFLAE